MIAAALKQLPVQSWPHNHFVGQLLYLVLATLTSTPVVPLDCQGILVALNLSLRHEDDMPCPSGGVPLTPENDFVSWAVCVPLCPGLSYWFRHCAH
jgi:hypothetical protein